MLDVDGSLLEPERFIPAAERFDLMPTLDRWVVEQACRFLSAQPVQDQHLLIMINLSGKSLSDKSFLGFVADSIENSNVSPKCFCFEITETAAVSNLTLVNQFVNHLHEMGCRFALDDFGSGLSSFAYLKNLPVDYLKIDGAFVRNIAHSEVDRAMVEAINNIGHVLGIQTIAEFVDKPEVLEILRELGIDYVQGYHIGRPQPLEQLNAASEEASGAQPMLGDPKFSVS